MSVHKKNSAQSVQPFGRLYANVLFYYIEIVVISARPADLAEQLKKTRIRPIELSILQITQLLMKLLLILKF